MRNKEFPQILLIGGCAGTGKSTLAQQIAKEFGVSVIQVDDLRLAIQAATLPQQNPGIHAFAEGNKVHDPGADETFENLIAVAHALEPAILAVMAHHLAVPSAGNIIIEGDGILPRLGSSSYLREEPFVLGSNTNMIKAGFLFEEEKEVLQENMAKRGRAFSGKSSVAQKAQVEGSWRYGKYLQEEASKHKLPLIAARPYTDLKDRFISKIFQE